MAAAFGLARKWAERGATARAQDKFREVLALDPDGKAGPFADEEGTKITASYADFARYEIARAAAWSRRPGPDLAPIKAFIADRPKNPLVREAYRQLSRYYGSAGSKEDAATFFAEYASRYPDDPEPLSAWLRRIIRDGGPLDKGKDLAAELRRLTLADPKPGTNQMLAQFYELAGDRAKAEDVYGPAFMQGRVQDLAYSLMVYAVYWVDKKENRDSALAMADTALGLQPGDLWYIRQAAYVRVTAGDTAKALQIYGPAWLEKNIAGAEPHDIRSYAMFWTRTGSNLESALAAAKKAVELQPQTNYFWTTLGDVYDKLGNRVEAVKALEKALELTPPGERAGLQKKLDALKALN